MKFSDLNNKEIVFKTCEIHRELCYAGEYCPVCVAVVECELALGSAEYERTQLEGKIDDLENRLQGYKDLL